MYKFYLCTFLLLLSATTTTTTFVSGATTLKSKEGGAINNKFGIGVYSAGTAATTISPSVLAQLPWAINLTGSGGRVIFLLELLFAENGNVSSCLHGCVPDAAALAPIKQAYAMGLRPVVRLGQWPRTIRDFSDDPQHLHYTTLAAAYRKFAAALPLPPDDSSSSSSSTLEIIVLNEVNTGAEWRCSGNGYLSVEDTPPEAAGCLRDILTALRSLPRLLLSPSPTAYTNPSPYPCEGNPNGKPGKVNWSQPTDIAFMKGMIAAVPDLYTRHADFLNSHPYPFHSQPFAEPLGRAGAVHYRAQLNASGRSHDNDFSVLITEAGWSGTNESEKAESIVAALQEEWLPDKRVAGVMPFLLSAPANSSFAGKGWPWVLWPARAYSSSSTSTSGGSRPTATLEYNRTLALRCRLGIGGPCT